MYETGRVRVFQDQGEVTIEIGPYRNRYVTLRQVLSAIVFISLAVQSARIFGPLIHFGHRLLGSSYIALLAFLAIVSAARFIWFAYGYEEIVLRGGLLTVSTRLGLFKTTRVYRLSEVRDIHTASHLGNAFRPSKGRIGFRYRNRMHYMAARIGSHEARGLVRLFRDWLPREVWTPVLGL